MPKKTNPAPKSKPAPAPAAEKPKPASTYRTPGGFTQTPIYLSDAQRRALYARAAEETAERGSRVSISDIGRRAICEYLGMTEADE